MGERGGRGGDRGGGIKRGIEEREAEVRGVARECVGEWMWWRVDVVGVGGQVRCKKR